MRWLTFSIVAFVALVLEAGLHPLLTVNGAMPSLLLVVLVFIGLMAPSAAVAWAALVLGLLADLSGAAGPALPSGGVLVGPATLGFLAGAYATVQLRTLVFRESVLTLAVMTFVAGVFVQLVIVALFTIRGLPITPAEPMENWVAADQLVRRFLELVYSAAVAVPAGVLLFRYAGVWAFPKVPRMDRHF